MTYERACANDDLWPNSHLFRDYLRLKAEVPSALLFLEMGASLRHGARTPFVPLRF